VRRRGVPHSAASGQCVTHFLQVFSNPPGEIPSTTSARHYTKKKEKSFHILISSRDQAVVGEQQEAGSKDETAIWNGSAVRRHATGLTSLTIRNSHFTIYRYNDTTHNRQLYFRVSNIAQRFKIRLGLPTTRGAWGRFVSVSHRH